MQAVAIIGAGELGAAIAHALATHEHARDIRLIDDAGAVACGKALDIRQAGAIRGSGTRVVGGSALDDAAGARVIVVADRAAAEGEWHGDAALERLRRLVAIAPRAVLVFAGTRQHDLLGLAFRELRVARERLVGTAPDALAAAVRALAALHADVSTAEVIAPVLGTPPRWVFAWHEAQAAGVPLSALLSAPELARLEARARASWPPGPFALGSAAARAVHACLHGSSRRFAVFAMLDGEYGARGIVTAVPARLGPHGVEAVYTTTLSAREQVAFQTALQAR